MARDEEPCQRADHYGGAYNQDNAHSYGRRISEDAEGDARIAAAHKINEIVNELMVPALIRLRFEQRFACAVEQNNPEG